MMFTLTPTDPPEEEQEDMSPVPPATFFNQHLEVEDDGFCGGLDEDLWWEDDQQDFDFGNF